MCPLRVGNVVVNATNSGLILQRIKSDLGQQQTNQLQTWSGASKMCECTTPGTIGVSWNCIRITDAHMLDNKVVFQIENPNILNSHLCVVDTVVLKYIDASKKYILAPNKLVYGSSGREFPEPPESPEDHTVKRRKRRKRSHDAPVRTPVRSATDMFCIFCGRRKESTEVSSTHRATGGSEAFCDGQCQPQ